MANQLPLHEQLSNMVQEQMSQVLIVVKGKVLRLLNAPNLSPNGGFVFAYPLNGKPQDTSCIWMKDIEKVMHEEGCDAAEEDDDADW